jgi:hypothetical protein
MILCGGMRATLLALLALSNPFSNCVTSGVSPATLWKNTTRSHCYC